MYQLFKSVMILLNLPSLDKLECIKNNTNTIGITKLTIGIKQNNNGGVKLLYADCLFQYFPHNTEITIVTI